MASTRDVRSSLERDLGTTPQCGTAFRSYTCLSFEWRASVRSSSLDTLSKESELLFTLLRARRDIEPNEAPIVVPDSPLITSIFLREARTEAISNSIGSRAVQRHPYLEWEALSEVFGGEDILKTRLEALRASDLATDDELMELAS